MRVLICKPDEAKIVGHHAAILLSQIRYWFFKAADGKSRHVVYRYDQKWVAHSREQLCLETGFSSKQLRTALEKLRTHGYIEIEQHLFGGKNVGHFRVEAEGPITPVAKSGAKSDGTGALGGAKKGLPDVAASGQLLKTNTTLDLNTEASAILAPSNNLKILQEGKKKKKGNIKDEHSAGKVCGFDNFRYDGSGHTPGKPKENSAQIANAFLGSWGKTYPKEKPIEFGPKEFGHFKNMINRIPPGMTEQTVKHCVENWHCFICKASDAEGAHHPPDRPDVGFLLWFIQSAINCFFEMNGIDWKKAVPAAYASVGA